MLGSIHLDGLLAAAAGAEAALQSLSAESKQVRSVVGEILSELAELRLPGAGVTLQRPSFRSVHAYADLAAPT
jgi:hypothetical protein